MNPGTDDDLFGAIGRLTISWAHLDLGLDCLMEIVYHLSKPKPIDEELPISLSKKIAFIRDAIKAFPIGDEAIEGYLKLLHKIQNAAEFRHDVIHGAVVEQLEGSNEATLVRMIRKKKEWKERRVKVTTLQVLKESVKVSKLGGTMLNVAVEIRTKIEELTKQHGEKNA